jgi:hypothetical protein
MDEFSMHEAIIYEICLGEVLDEKWGEYFAPFSLTVNDKETRLIGIVHDQAELFGVILKIRDLGLRLLSVNPITEE